MNDIFASTPVHFLVEGTTDEFVARRLLSHAGFIPGKAFGGKGKAYLLERLPKYNQAARVNLWFAMVDLDNDELCASQAIAKWLPRIAEGMVLRVAVRAVEAWLMADVEQIAPFLHVSPSIFPNNPDTEADPKEKLVNIARRSTNKSMRDDMVPRQGSEGRVGSRYAIRLNEFTIKYWRPEEAMLRSDSLCRCIKALSTLRNGKLLGSEEQ